ncbi:hypothetical protein BX600DRAFT_517027 [Xylariales sp. PMI_506]|nr:hypothetical protein BX600DRAFT_517027 [Xylariales sp. PMI_506]
MDITDTGNRYNLKRATNNLDQVNNQHNEPTSNYMDDTSAVSKDPVNTHITRSSNKRDTETTMDSGDRPADSSQTATTQPSGEEKSHKTDELSETFHDGQTDREDHGTLIGQNPYKVAAAGVGVFLGLNWILGKISNTLSQVMHFPKMAGFSKLPTPSDVSKQMPDIQDLIDRLPERLSDLPEHFPQGLRNWMIQSSKQQEDLPVVWTDLPWKDMPMELIKELNEITPNLKDMKAQMNNSSNRFESISTALVHFLLVVSKIALVAIMMTASLGLLWMIYLRFNQGKNSGYKDNLEQIQQQASHHWNNLLQKMREKVMIPVRQRLVKRETHPQSNEYTQPRIFNKHDQTEYTSRTGDKKSNVEDE